MQTTILHNQSLLDVCLQHTGSLESLFDIAMANGVSITDDLTPGQSLVVPDEVKTDKDILNYYRAKGVQPATAIMVMADNVEVLEGISVWAIGNDFIIS